MKFTLVCLSVLVAVASTAPQYPFLPTIGSPLLPVQPCAQDELGRLIPGGLVYPAQENIQIGSWPWGPMGLTPFYPTDPRFLVFPGTGFPVAPGTPNVVKPIVSITSPVVTGDDNSNLKPIAPTLPVAPTTPVESKPREMLSPTPTIAGRSRCLKDYRRTKRGAPENVYYMVASDIAMKNEFPFMVGLLEFNDTVNDYVLACGGSLISPTKILTAAHCVTEYRTSRLMPTYQFKVKLGMHFLNLTTNDAQLSRNVINIKVHEEYISDRVKTVNDLAILTLDAPVEYTKTISPVCLVPDCINDDNEQLVTAMGWGDTKSGGKNSDFLRFAELSTVSSVKCGKKYGQFDENAMICAYKEGQDTCQNDSGGPLVIDAGYEKTSCRFMQVGIVSFGDGCAKKGTPGVYVRVKNFLPWILENSK